MAGITPGPGAGEDGDGAPEDASGPVPEAAPRAWLHPSELGPRLDRMPEPPPAPPRAPGPTPTRPGRAVPVLATAAIALVATLGVARAVQSTDSTTPQAAATGATPQWPVVPVRAVGTEGARVATGLCVHGGVVTAADALAGATIVTVATARGSVRARVAAADAGSGLAYLTGVPCSAGPARISTASTARDGEPVVLLTARRPTGASHSWARLVDTDATSAATLLRSDPLATPAGAPVLDRRGDLVAIVVGAGGGRLAAAPSNLVGRVVAQFVAGLPVRAGWLGVEVDIRGGVVRVADGSPAARAGIAPGDSIYAVDGRRTATVDLVLGSLQAHAPGDRITVTVERDGRTRDLTPRLAVPPGP